MRLEDLHDLGLSLRGALNKGCQYHFPSFCLTHDVSFFKDVL